MKNNFLEEMKSRGYLSQCTNFDKLSEICSKKSISGYIGFDCTAKSLHVGSLLQIMILKLMQKYGHRPIVLMGGGTTLIEALRKRPILSTKALFLRFFSNTYKPSSSVATPWSSYL